LSGLEIIFSTHSSPLSICHSTSPGFSENIVVVYFCESPDLTSFGPWINTLSGAEIHNSELLVKQSLPNKFCKDSTCSILGVDISILPFRFNLPPLSITFLNSIKLAGATSFHEIPDKFNSSPLTTSFVHL
jgi:hypothetical protein